ncbi:MAG: M48 family metallopeptidase [Patescibacteria group bacterium]
MDSQRISIRKTKLAKRITLTVKSSGRVSITAPKLTSDTFIYEFVESKRDWINEQLEKFENEPGSLLLKGNKEDYLQYKNEARKIVIERLNYFNSFYNYHYEKVTIRNQTTLWGSCSAKNNLNFNYKIVFLPKELQDYIIVHELCHLKEFNHSAEYWKLVQKTMPNYKNLRKALKNLT